MALLAASSFSATSLRPLLVETSASRLDRDAHGMPSKGPQRRAGPNSASSPSRLKAFVAQTSSRLGEAFNPTYSFKTYGESKQAKAEQLVRIDPAEEPEVQLNTPQYIVKFPMGCHDEHIS